MPRFTSNILALLKIACVLALFGVIFGVSGYLTVRWSLSGEEIQVPEVVGLTLAEAQGQLASMGFEVEVDDVDFSSEVIPRGHVLRQNPPGGTSVKRQRGIVLTLSSGLPGVYVPDTAGDVFTKAQISLQQQEVELDYIARVHSYELAEDRVISQQPDLAELGPGDTLRARLLVSLGPAPQVYVMPELIGQPLEVVRTFLESNGFRLAPVSRRDDPGVPADTIVNQDPPSGFRVRAGDVVKLVVSR